MYIRRNDKKELLIISTENSDAILKRKRSQMRKIFQTWFSLSKDTFEHVSSLFIIPLRNRGWW